MQMLSFPLSFSSHKHTYTNSEGKRCYKTTNERQTRCDRKWEKEWEGERARDREKRTEREIEKKEPRER